MANPYFSYSALFVALVVAFGVGGEPFSEAERTLRPSGHGADSTPWTLLASDDSGRTGDADIPSDDSAPVCDHPSGWRAATNGYGMFAVVYRNGPARVTVSVLSAYGATERTVYVGPGDGRAFVDFPEVPPLSVHLAYSSTVAPGSYSIRCRLERTDD